LQSLYILTEQIGRLDNMSWDAPYPEWPLKKPKNPTALTYDADNPPQDVVLPAQDIATPYAPTGITGLAPNNYGIPNLFGTPNTVPQGTLNNGSEPGSPEPYNPNSGIITDNFGEYLNNVPQGKLNNGIEPGSPEPYNPNSGIITETNSYQEYANAPQQTLNNGSEPATPAVDPRSPTNQVVEDAAPTGVFGLPITPAQPAQKPAAQAAPTAPAPEIVSGLTNQILGQGLTSKWQGEGHGSAEKNAADMARIMASIGITDIKQFGEVPKLEQATIREGYKGQVAQQDEGGYYVVSPPDADGNTSRINVDPSQLTKAYGYQDADGNFKTVDPSKVVEKNGMALVETGKTYGNKLTGQEVPMTYSERQTGNAWGGTFAGKDNTGYRVQFGADGTPYFYTTKSSSNDLANIMADMGPVGQIALAAATGGLSLPAQLAANAAFQLLAGGNLKDVAKGTALSYLGGQAGNLISGSQGITDLLGKTGTDIAAKTAQQFVGSGGQADLGKALLGSAVGTGVNSAIDQVPGMENLSPADKNMASSILAAAATGVPIDQAIQNAVVGRASSAASGAVAQARANEESTPSKFNFNEFFPSTNNQTANPVTVSQQPPDDEDFVNQLQQYKQPSIDDLLASIQPKTQDTTTDKSQSNQEILNSIGYEEPRTLPKENTSITDDEIKPADLPFDTSTILPNLPQETTIDDLVKSIGGEDKELEEVNRITNPDGSSSVLKSDGNYYIYDEDGKLDGVMPNERGFGPNRGDEDLINKSTTDTLLNEDTADQSAGKDNAMEDDYMDNQSLFDLVPNMTAQDYDDQAGLLANQNLYNDAGDLMRIPENNDDFGNLYNENGELIRVPEMEDEYTTDSLGNIYKNGTLFRTKEDATGEDSSGTKAGTTGSKAGSAATKAGTAAKPGTSPGTSNNGLIMALMAMMAMMNSRGGGSSGAASTIPALSANRSQLPYAPVGRPGAGGQTYFSPTTYTPKAAEGGLMGLAGGGMSSLGGYSDGGRLLRGPGDGVSDSIPATIGGKQPARLAEGEFVVPARIVSELGNGSTNAGANKLYDMMDRVQKARRQTKNVAADTKAHKYLPS
jgi:hypothetical protein